MAFLTIAEAIAKHGKSESTFRRLIRDVRRAGDSRKRRLIKPSEEEIAQYRSRAEQFAYTMAEELIQQELFGRRTEQGSEPSPSTVSADPQLQQLIDKIEQRYEQEITRLANQLAEEKREKAELLKYAQEDKKLFAQASQSLTQVLALPGIAEASKAQASRPIHGSAVEPMGDRGQGTRSSGKSRPPTHDEQRPKRETFLSRLFGRR